MELIKIKRFQHPDLAVKKTRFKQASVLHLSCFHYDENGSVITIGLSSGKIMQFTQQSSEQDSIFKGKRFDIYCYIDSKSHKGLITCIIAVQINGNLYYFSGSADSTVKVWFFKQKFRNVKYNSFQFEGVTPKIIEVDQSVVTQTLSGHQGTITALSYSNFNEVLFSASNDKTVKIWKQERKRQFFYHPWFVNVQVISDFSLKKQVRASYVTCFQLRDKEKDQFMLLAADSEGSLHQIAYDQKGSSRFKSQENKEDQLLLKKTKENYHRLSINALLSVPKDGFIFTLGYDQQIRGYEELSDKTFFSLKNPHKKLFTSVTWNQSKFELIAGDEGGFIYFINFGEEKETEEIKKYQCKIITVRIINSYLVVVTQHFIDVFLIKRGPKISGVNDCHTAPIIALAPLEPALLTNFKVKDPPKLISVSLDNTMRVWDPKDFSHLSVLSNQKQEISSLHYLRQANLFATGHQNGDVKLWNIQLGNSIVLLQNRQSPWQHYSNVCALASFIYQRGEANDDTTQFLFSSGYDGIVNIWQIFQKRNLMTSALMSSTICPQLKYSVMACKDQQTPNQIGSQILALAFYVGKGVRGHHDNYIIAGGNKGVIYIIQMFTFQHKPSLYGHTDSINTLLLDQFFLFSGSDDLTVRMWNMNDMMPLQVLNLFNYPVRYMTMAIYGSQGLLAVLTTDSTVSLVDYIKGQINSSHTQKKQKIRCMSFVESLGKICIGTQQHNLLGIDLDKLVGESKPERLVQDSLVQELPP